jgi:hypothetical protein
VRAVARSEGARLNHWWIVRLLCFCLPTRRRNREHGASPGANENINLKTGAAMTNDVLALINEIQRYAGNRQSDVMRGAETAAFAALMVEKFGEGLVKAGYLLGVEDSEELKQTINRLVREIDPQYPTHLQYRFEARPAGLAINGTTH